MAEISRTHNVKLVNFTEQHELTEDFLKLGYNPLSTQPEWGNSLGMRTRHNNATAIVHRAKFAILGCDMCSGDRQRRYFYINENSIEINEPSTCTCFVPGIPFITGGNPLGCFELFSVPPNICCRGNDHIKKVYFDRGIFDRQNCWWTIGFWAGKPSFFANELKHTVCCQECCPTFDRMMSCYYPSLCGERVRYVPAEFCCWCVPLRTGSCGNCCGCCGPLTDMPYELCMYPVVSGLEEDEADHMVNSFNKAVNEWNEYTGAGKF